MVISLLFRPKRIILAILLIIFFSLLIMNYRAISLPSYTSNMEFRIVIDPGHGSIDTGTSYRNIYEKEINLQIAKYLAEEFKKVNIIPIMTRTKDKLYHNSRRKDIRRRPEIAGETDADLFISIHANNFPTSQPSGSQIFCKFNSEQSKKLAECIQQELIELRNENNRSIKQGDYYVLNKIDCPGILIEVGFLSNPSDRQKLTDPVYQQQFAKAIKNGVINYFLSELGKTKDRNKRDIETNQKTAVNKKVSIEPGDRALYYLSYNEKDVYLIKNNMSFPANSFFVKEHSTLKFNEVLAISAIRQLLNPPEGLISPLPPGTKIKSLKIEDNTAILNLSFEARENFNGGANQEEKVVSAIRKTLLSIKDIEDVEILIDGQKGESLGGHILLD